MTQEITHHSMTEKEKAILKFLSGRGEVGGLALVEATRGTGAVSTSLVLETMVANGLIERRCPPRGQKFYKIAEAGKTALGGGNG